MDTEQVFVSSDVVAHYQDCNIVSVEGHWLDLIAHLENDSWQ